MLVIRGPQRASPCTHYLPEDTVPCHLLCTSAVQCQVAVLLILLHNQSLCHNVRMIQGVLECGSPLDHISWLPPGPIRVSQYLPSQTWFPCSQPITSLQSFSDREKILKVSHESVCDQDVFFPEYTTSESETRNVFIIFLFPQLTCTCTT